ncbi:MAG: RNA chaperone Hfq [Alphaproteobacteria bacterium]
MTQKTTAFLEKIQTEKLPVTVFLTYGVKLQGIITASDETAILLRREAHTQLIYKHAISTIMPVAAVDVEG